MGLEFNYPGLNPASPDHPMSVRQSNGSGFGAAPEFLLDVSRGAIPGWSTVLLYGSKFDIGTTESDLWRGPTDIVWPLVAAPMSVVSTSDEDAAEQTGVSLIAITGLDANLDELVEVLELTGTTPAVTSGSFLRVNQALAIAAGSAEENVGNITGTINGGAVMYIAATDSATLQFSYTVPRNHELYILRANVWQGRDNAGTTSLRIRPPGLPWFRLGSNEIYRGQISSDIPFAPVGEKSDMRVTGKQISGGGTTALFSTVAAVLKDLAIDPIG